MLGEVPTRVQMPPSSEAKDIGISTRDGATPIRRAAFSAEGISMARAPMFLVVSDRPVTEKTRAGTSPWAVWKRRSSGCMSRSTTPERAMAALMIRAEAMITTTSLLKPSKAVFTGTTPMAIPTSSVTRETTSYRKRPQMKTRIAPPIRANASA